MGQKLSSVVFHHHVEHRGTALAMAHLTYVGIGSGPAVANKSK